MAVSFKAVPEQIGRIKFKHILFLILIIGLLSVPKSVQAVGRESLTLSPLRQELKLIPGQKYDGSIKLENSGQVELELDLYASSFRVKNENYDQEFDQDDNPLSSKNWFKFSQTKLRLPPKTKKTINYSIAVPQNAEPGGQYVAIFAQTKTSSQLRSDVIEVKRLASLIYMEVAGDIIRIGKIQSLQNKFWQNSDPVKSRLRLRSDGNTHFRADGFVRIKNIFGKEISSARVNGLILPTSTRLFEINNQTPNWPGLYKIQADISFPDGTRQSKTNWIIYVPNLYIVITGLLLLGLTIYYSWRHFHKSKT